MAVIEGKGESSQQRAFERVIRSDGHGVGVGMTGRASGNGGGLGVYLGIDATQRGVSR